MKRHSFFFIPSMVLVCVQLCYAQTRPKKDAGNENMHAERLDTAAPVITHHSLTIDGKVINYTATAGYMPMKDRDSATKLMARIFYVAYTVENGSKPEKRPITFAFNGGPGSSSIWLHMGAISPVRVNFANDKGDAPAPPFSYSDNPNSWIGFTDLVFIDPVSTGYSRPASGVNAQEYHGYSQDIASVGDFIRLYTTMNERWNSPKFLAGESYGTTRASGLSSYLQGTYGMYLNGITLISSVLNFEYIDFTPGNELPYALFLPTYSTTAQYHKKLSSDLNSMNTALLAKKAKIFAEGTYSYFLMQGDQASDQLINTVIDSLNYFTGLSKDYIRKSNERILDQRFFKELLRDEGKTIGRFDGRYTGEDVDDVGEYHTYDPSYSAVSGLFNGVFNDYVRKGLGYKNDLPYHALTNVWPWDFKPFENTYLDVTQSLRSAMTANPGLKVMVCCGYYDLATPFCNAEYAVNHMGLRKDVRNNISLTYYNAGHMMYVNKDDEVKLKADAEKFYLNSVK